MDDLLQPQKFGVLGGTFDPVHNGHLQIGRWALQHFDLEKFLFIPNRIHPFFKRGNISTAEQRLTMLQAAIAGEERFQVDAYELHQDGVSYTIDTLYYLKQKFQNSKFFLFIGTDNVADFDRWKSASEILNLCSVCVYRRNLGAQGVDESDPRFIFLETPLIDISSTDIRTRLEQGKTCKNLLPPAVEAFIHEQQLYRQLL